ncbi:MAG: DUF4123 domain-containing protein [Marinobacter sp.]|uniref:DUF4123 domain-containing protein n=1 Tax=Marinobacter sp. TaxID=50741 RepID=UPI00299E2A9D|nr:DUF4123 domain-containing protein [Marinobacter sp.]MDX1757890.1 DUF4123 domain-containing protein [Marinobacter sp.]
MLDVFEGPAVDRDQDIHCNYILIDGSKRNEAERWLYELLDAPDYRNLFDGTEWASIRQVAPLLVRTEPDHPLMGQLMQEGNVLEWGYGIASDEPLDSVANHLRRFITVRHPLGHNVMLRFADPTVAWVLLAPPGEGGLTEYWQTLTAVKLPDALWNDWHIQTRPERLDSETGVNPNDVATLHLSEVTLSCLLDTDRRATLVKLMQHLETYFPDRVTSSLRAEVVFALRQLMNQAIDNGYSSLQALTHWCTVYGYLGEPSEWASVAPDIHQMFQQPPVETGDVQARKAAVAAMELAQTQHAGRAESWE